MKTLAALLGYSFFAFNLLGPVFVLLLAKRRGLNWRRAAKWCALTAAVGAYLVGGTLYTFQLAANGPLFRNGPGALAHAAPFPYGGAAGVLVAIFGLVFTLPALALWSALHPRSFGYVTKPRRETEARV